MKNTTLLDEYSFPGFKPIKKIKGTFGDSHAIIIPLKRSQKKRYVVAVEQCTTRITTKRHNWSGICPAEANESILRLKAGVLIARNVAK